jgi:hypothetical protein
MEIKEQYRTIKNEDFVAMEKHIAELEQFRSANRILVDIKVSDRRYRRIGSFGYPTGEYVARHVILSEIIGADVAGLYEPISKALKKEFDSAMINNQGAIAAIRNEHEQMEKMYREMRMAKSDLEFKQLTKKEEVESSTSIYKYLFFGMVILITIILSARSCQAQTKIAPTYKALEMSYIALNYADTHLTYKGLQHGATEANPAARWLYDRDLLIPGKILVTGGTLWMFRRMYAESPRTAYVYLIAANLIYSAVVVNNYVVTVRLKI